MRILTSSVMVNASLGQHSVVLDLRLLERRTVAGDDHQPSLTLTEGLQGGLVTKGGLTTLHDKGKAGVDVLLGLFL